MATNYCVNIYIITKSDKYFESLQYLETEECDEFVNNGHGVDECSCFHFFPSFYKKKTGLVSPKLLQSSPFQLVRCERIPKNLEDGMLIIHEDIDMLKEYVRSKLPHPCLFITNGKGEGFKIGRDLTENTCLIDTVDSQLFVNKNDLKTCIISSVLKKNLCDAGFL